MKAMTYFPTIDLTGQIRLLLSRGALRLQPGQWVRENGRQGRYLRTNPRTGVTSVCWVRPGDTVAGHARRFHRACVKGFVGRHARLYPAVRTEREIRRKRNAAVQPVLPDLAAT